MGSWFTGRRQFARAYHSPLGTWRSGNRSGFASPFSDRPSWMPGPGLASVSPWEACPVVSDPVSEGEVVSVVAGSTRRWRAGRGQRKGVPLPVMPLDVGGEPALVVVALEARGRPWYPPPQTGLGWTRGEGRWGQAKAWDLGFARHDSVLPSKSLLYPCAEAKLFANRLPRGAKLCLRTPI